MFEVVRCTIPDRLRKLDMTQQELAEHTGLSKSHLSDIVHLRQIASIPTGMKISYILKCHIEDLYEWKRSGGM